MSTLCAGCLDPQAALKSASLIVERLLDRERDNNGGQYPESIALVLWGTDNIKTYGESLAQVRAAAAAGGGGGGGAGPLSSMCIQRPCYMLKQARARPLSSMIMYLQQKTTLRFAKPLDCLACLACITAPRT